MRAGLVTKIEKYVDRVAAVLFAGACGYASFVWFAQEAAMPLLGAETAAVSGLTYLISWRALRAVRPKSRKLPVPIFDVRQLDAIDLAEPLEAEPAAENSASTDEPLVLDDILADLGPDSRVVRLFDPAAMPTPGQLNARIARHLDRDAAPVASHDASQALHDALAELRRSLG